MIASEKGEHEWYYSATFIALYLLYQRTIGKIPHKNLYD